MTVIVLKILGYADGRPCAWDGMFVKSMDFEAHDGRGSISPTDDVEKAKHFISARQAYEYFNMVPANRPVRPDGKPNKPLTAFNLEVLPYHIQGGK